MMQWRIKLRTRQAGLATVLTALIAGIALAAPAQAAPWAGPTAPKRLGGAQAPDGTAGNIYVGAVPPGSATKPVLVFVHGKSGEAASWWTDTAYHGHNDMYDYAYNYGYRTAFVDLYDASGPAPSMWDNGQLLSGQIRTIANYYHVPAVNVIAHSKGGVDTQTAIVYYGAGPQVQTLVTLSSPHWGSPLADLAYSSWTWWLAALLGERTDGTYVLQTGYMSWYRSITDPRAENAGTRYYTGGGTSWGPLFSALWFGGSYLSGWGDNDGLVPLRYSTNPRGTSIFTRNLDHDNVRMGSTVFPTVNPYVSSLWRAAAPAPAPAPANMTPPQPGDSSNILRGGPIAAGSKEKPAVTRDGIAVEPGVRHLTLDLLSNVDMLDLRWTAPDGTLYPAKPVAGQGEIFSKAYHYQVDVDAPAAGAWNLRLTNAGAQAAYLLVANLQSPVQVELTRDPALTFAPGSPLALQVRASDTSGRQVAGLQVQGDVTLDGAAGTAGFSAQGSGARLAPTVTLPAGSGVANLSLTVRGQLSDGSSFERQIVTSVPVVGKGQSLPTP